MQRLCLNEELGGLVIHRKTAVIIICDYMKWWLYDDTAMKMGSHILCTVSTPDEKIVGVIGLTWRENFL